MLEATRVLLYFDPLLALGLNFVGKFCPSQGLPVEGPNCAPGLFAIAGSSACLPCPRGRFGAGGSTSSQCDGPCIATPGNVCGLGISAPTGIPCMYSVWTVRARARLKATQLCFAPHSPVVSMVHPHACVKGLL